MNTEKKRLSLKDLDLLIDEPVAFGNSLKAERQSRGMTRREFSELLNITIQSLADLEQGRRIPSAERAAKIAEQIKQPIAYWIQLAFQDQLNQKQISLHVTVA